MQLHVPLSIPDKLTELAGALSVLTAMITPTLLISATGTFILSTSNRLGRVIDRVRKLTEIIETLMHEGPNVELIEDRRALYLTAASRQSRRAEILQRTLRIFYLAAAMFILTSVAIGIAAVFPRGFNWLPVVLGITGACLLLLGAIHLLFEAKLSHDGLLAEIAFIQKLVALHSLPPAPKEPPSGG